MISGQTPESRRRRYFDDYFDQCHQEGETNDEYHEERAVRSHFARIALNETGNPSVEQNETLAEKSEA